MGGLKEEIRSAIALHRPADVDSASALALLQEEELENAKKNTVKPWKQVGDAKGYPKKQEFLNAHKRVDDKVEDLKSFRKQNGLCYKCGEKWGHNHKCPPQVPLHVLEELWDAMQSTSEENENEPATKPEEVVLAVNRDTPPSSRRTMKFLAHIGKTQVLVLVDSGSVGTFVSEAMVKKLKLPTLTSNQVQYKAADGGLMTCNQYVSELK